MAQTAGSARSIGSTISFLFEVQARLVRSLVSVAALLTLSGCYTNHVRTPVSDASLVQGHRSVEADTIFDYVKAEIQFTNHASGAGVTSMYELRELEIPSIGENGQDEGIGISFRSTPG